MTWWFAACSRRETSSGIPRTLQTSIHSIYRSVQCNPVHHRQRKCRRASWRLCWWFAGSSRSETTGEYHRRYRCPYTLYTAVSTATLCTPYTPYTAVSTATLCTIVSGRSAGGLVGGFAGGLQDPVVVARDVGVVAVLVLAVAAHAPGHDAHQHEAARVLHDVGTAAVARAGVAPHAA